MLRLTDVLFLLIWAAFHPVKAIQALLMRLLSLFNGGRPLWDSRKMRPILRLIVPTTTRFLEFSESTLAAMIDRHRDPESCAQLFRSVSDFVHTSITSQMAMVAVATGKSSVALEPPYGRLRDKWAVGYLMGLCNVFYGHMMYDTIQSAAPREVRAMTIQALISAFGTRDGCGMAKDAQTWATKANGAFVSGFSAGEGDAVAYVNDKAVPVGLARYFHKR